MKNKTKNILTALAFCAVSGGLLAFNAYAVPNIATLTQTNPHAPQSFVASATQEKSAITLASSNVPVLNVEEKVPVSTVKDELERTMTAEEMQQIYNYVDNSKNEFLKANRQMSAQESKRRQALEDRYVYDGVRPQNKLPLKPGISSFYFDMSKDIWIYPDRELTDEELLQHIDWNYRVNFALSKRYQNQQPDAKDIGKEEAMAKARESVSKLFDADISKMKASAAFNKFGPEQKGEWLVHFQPYRALTLDANGSAYMMYDVMIDALSGTVIDTTIFNSAYKKTPITSEMNKQIRQDPSWIEAAKNVVLKKQGETRAIQKSTIIQDQVYDKRGVVAVSIELKDGSSYTVELRYPEKTLRCLIYDPAASGK
ncbi:hypothetical protein [Paenibacillus azoreducens]|uniref:PepSY domain-containing protein n=1 Tax=Paenibacillus azoreducens TaxID=116718 RepID=A0A919YG73_9BACL|nr:hypothetical protein [Paenibacillus azoreducens]GIO51066.1 hypothetical protein J34TS1_58310 [Paenibacillus azoreducens]